MCIKNFEKLNFIIILGMFLKKIWYLQFTAKPTQETEELKIFKTKGKEKLVF